MKIVIDIPKEFEEHYKTDKFEDSLARVASDIESFGFNLSGRYEQETITMLREAFKNGTPLPKGHGRIIDESKIKSVYAYTEEAIANNIKAMNTIITGTDAPTIIEADKGVLAKINEKQDSLRATCKAWDEAIEKDGYVN